MRPHSSLIQAEFLDDGFKSHHILALKEFEDVVFAGSAADLGWPDLAAIEDALREHALECIVLTC